MNRNLLLLLFCCFFNALLAQESTERGLKADKPKGLAYKEKYAIFIGINNYKDSKIPSLKYAVSDAKALSQVFINQLGFDSKKVIVLLDSMATRTAILDTLEYFIRSENIPENSQLIVYFGGHGNVSKSGNKGFLLNYDSKEGSEFSTAISTDEIARIGSECQNKHVLFLIDACYGGFANRRSIESTFIKNVWSQKAKIAITAGTSEEKVVEAEKWQHSAFTKVLLDALERKEADGNLDNIVTSTELYSYLENRVSYYAGLVGGKQTPKTGKLTADEGTIFLELKSGALGSLNENAQMMSDNEIAEKFYSKVIITSNVKSARVFRDGVEVGYLVDGRFENSVTPGFYKFDLRLDRFENTSIETIVKPDTTITVNMPMESKFSTVNFKVEPDDAAVVLNGNLIGTGSFTTDILKGRHEILIEKKGYKPEKTIINLVRDITPLSFSIQKISATVELYSNPSGAIIINNSDTLGKTPSTITLGYGHHNLIFSKKDYLTKQLSVDINESGLQRHDILLNEKPEIVIGREVKKLRGKTIGKVFINGALGGASYFGYQYLNNLVKEELNKTKPSSDLDIYKAGKYTSLALTGIFTLGTTINLVKIFTFNKEKLLRKKMEETTNVSLFPTKKGMGIALNFKF